MSRWLLRRHLRAWLSPSRVVLATAPALWSRAPSEPAIEASVDGPGGAGAFEPMLEAFREQLPRSSARRRIDVCLSDHFVRYLVLAPRPGMNEGDWPAYALHEFERVYGRCAGPRMLRIAPARRGAARVAAALDAALVAGLTQAARANRSRIGAIEPNLCRVVNRFERGLKGDGHLLVLEPQRLTRLTAIRGTWSEVQSVRCGEDAVEAIRRMLAELRCSPTDAADGTRTWLWGLADALAKPMAVDGAAFAVLAKPDALPDACAAVGLL